MSSHHSSPDATISQRHLSELAPSAYGCAPISTPGTPPTAQTSGGTTRADDLDTYPNNRSCARARARERAPETKRKVKHLPKCKVKRKVNTLPERKVTG